MKIGAKSKGFFDVPAEGMLVIDSQELVGQDFSGRKLLQYCAISSKFDRCNFSKMIINDACFGGGDKDSEYVDCVFDGAKFTAITPGAARFVRCSFRGVVISNLICNRVEFVDCTFSGKLKVGIFNGAVPNVYWDDLGRKINKFYGNDFREMELLDVSFRSGIDLSSQVLPVGDQYLYLPSALEQVRNLKSNIPDSVSDEREGIERLLRIMERHLSAGQDQLFLNITAFRKQAIPAARLIKGLLLRAQ
jgi:hypothetical protein